MNEKIQHIIQDIASKKQLLVDKIQELGSQLAISIKKQEDFEALITDLSKKNTLLEQQIVELQEELEFTKMKNVQIVEESVQVKSLTGEEIDALVGEIDYCLNQLKK